MSSSASGDSGGGRSMESRVGRSKQRESLPDAQYNIFCLKVSFSAHLTSAFYEAFVLVPSIPSLLPIFVV
jgi:hypothetical protein